MATGFVILFITFVQTVILIVIGRAYWRYTQLKKHGIKAQGIITDYEVRQSSKGRKTFFPIIKFKTYLGHEIHQKASYGLDKRQYIEKGQEVGLLYAENEPTTFMIDSYNPTLSFVIVFIGLIIGYIASVSILSDIDANWFQGLMNGLK